MFVSTCLAMLNSGDACMALHCMTYGALPATPLYTVLTSILQAMQIPGEGVVFVLMLVRSAGQMILGLWPETFEEI